MSDEAPVKGPVEILSNSAKHSDHQLVDDAGQRITVYFDGIEDEERMFRYIAACINRAPLLEMAEPILGRARSMNCLNLVFGDEPCRPPNFCDICASHRWLAAYDAATKETR